MNQITAPRRLLTWKHLKEDFRIPFCREHARRLEKAGQFPKRLRLSPQKVAWFEDEILAWLAERDAERGTRSYPNEE